MLVTVIPSIFAIVFIWLAIDNNKQGNRFLCVLCGIIALSCVFLALSQN